MHPFIYNFVQRTNIAANGALSQNLIAMSKQKG